MRDEGAEGTMINYVLWTFATIWREYQGTIRFVIIAMCNSSL